MAGSNTPKTSDVTSARHVVIIGGGLAGLAAAVGLADHGLSVELLEAKQSLGGRAGSFCDPETGAVLDHCQHVAMGCCTNFLDLCSRTGCFDLLERHRRLHFLSREGQRSDFAASRWLPAPLHLGPALLGMKHLSWRDKWCISRAIWRLMRLNSASVAAAPDTATWLDQQQQTSAAIERFWKVVLISALADSLENISLAATRKVFVDGFLAHRDAADVYIPRVPLQEIYDQHIATWLQARGVGIRFTTPVKSIASADGPQSGLVVHTKDEISAADAVIVAVPWKQLPLLLDESLLTQIPQWATLGTLSSSPISSVHLWTDRALLDLPHAVLVDRLSQWVFAREQDTSTGARQHYYQVVISASRELAGRPKEDVIEEVWNDLQAVFPVAREAQLLTARLITQRDAVFSVPARLPRISQSTSHPALFLAGDWTDTGWPATMEGAVRSGYLAAERVLASRGERPAGQTTPRLLQPDLPLSWLARSLLG